MPECRISTKCLLRSWYSRQREICFDETKSGVWCLSLPVLSRRWYNSASDSDDPVPSLETVQPNADVQLTLRLLSSNWYARRGRLASKNWGRLSEKERQSNVGGLVFGSAKGSIDGNIKSIVNELSKAIRCKRKLELQGLLAVGEAIKSTSIISTQEVGKVYITAKKGRPNSRKTYHIGLRT